MYRLLSEVFIEMDDGDKRFFRALSLQLWGEHNDYTLTIPHYWALVHLGRPEGRTMAELAQLLICDKSNVTAIVDKLEEQRWAERLRGKAGDRRFMQVILTPAGRVIRGQVMAAHAEWVRTRFAVLTPDQLEQLTSLLEILHPGFRLNPEPVVEQVSHNGAAAVSQPEPTLK